MKKLALGMALGIAVTVAGTAAAHEMTARAPTCRPTTIGYTCSLPHLGRNSNSFYTIKVRDLDSRACSLRAVRASRRKWPATGSASQA